MKIDEKNNSVKEKIFVDVFKLYDNTIYCEISFLFCWFIAPRGSAIASCDAYLFVTLAVSLQKIMVYKIK